MCGKFVGFMHAYKFIYSQISKYSALHKISYKSVYYANVKYNFILKKKKNNFIVTINNFMRNSVNDFCILKYYEISCSATNYASILMMYVRLDFFKSTCFNFKLVRC